MNWLLISSLLAICCQYVQAKHVFAHFMTTNTAEFTAQDWTNNFNLAKEAKIDGFAMNLVWKDGTNAAQLPMAFDIARNVGFKLFFSFDYAANGIWSYDDVLALMQNYISHPAYFRDPPTNRPLVSTFEGPIAAQNWTQIKVLTQCYIIPSWNSMTPSAVMAMNLANGLFNWDAWPEGNKEMVCPMVPSRTINLE